MSVVVYNVDGEPVARSRNLRGILTYARRHPVKRASVYAKGDGRAFVAFHFRGDAFARVEFESFIVAGDWVASRRSWALRLAGHNATIRDYVA
ncbi:hypothetical protein [Brevundimonas sp. SL161]|uniref:hypothetical protein n=1 Tax=Brevundimonas sp. SL161 TaxID=2804613 RepID=UPI003CEB4D27